MEQNNGNRCNRNEDRRRGAIKRSSDSPFRDCSAARSRELRARRVASRRAVSRATPRVRVLASLVVELVLHQPGKERQNSGAIAVNSAFNASMFRSTFCRKREKESSEPRVTKFRMVGFSSYLYFFRFFFFWFFGGRSL